MPSALPRLSSALAIGGLAALAALGSAIGADPALAQAAAAPVTEAAPAAAAAPTPNKGDTAWMLISTVLVLMMTIPGLALFYGGLVRTKNMLSLLTQIFGIVALVVVIWVTYGYSMTFTSGGSLNAYVGGFSKAFLNIAPEGKTIADAVVATFSNGVVIPELVYICFQMTFAAITPALIVGAFAERMKFSAIMLFTALWVTFVYFPIAHMVWYWAGPDAVGDAARALAAAGTDAAARTAAQARLDAVTADAGWIFQIGALDFAGGTVVHINAGIAGFVGCLIIGKRVGYGRELMAPHSLVMTMIGAALLWVGWFGFNAGSNLEANGVTALAMVNTFVATAAAALGWLVVEWLGKGKPSLLGMVSGAVSGLVAVTPASGFAGPMGALVLGLVAGVVCYLFCTSVKNSFGYDDSLDVFGIHCVGGIIGALGTGIVVSTAVGGTGVPDYISSPGSLVADANYTMAGQLWKQFQAVLITLVWSGVISAILFKLVDVVVGLRPSVEQEREGLDIVDHGERAYNY